MAVTELLNGEERVQEEAVHDTKAHMADIDITNVIEYVQDNRKEKYNTGFKIGIGCLVVSLVLFLLYLREAYRFQGNYFGTMIRMTVISGIFLLGEMVLERCYLEKLMPGVYEIREQSVPDGYLLNEAHQMITLFPNRTGTVQFQNYPKPTLTVNKIDSITGDPIKGAKFNVTFRSDKTSTGEIRDHGTYYSDDYGQFFID